MMISTMAMAEAVAVFAENNLRADIGERTPTNACWIQSKHFTVHFRATSFTIQVDFRKNPFS